MSVSIVVEDEGTLRAVLTKQGLILNEIPFSLGETETLVYLIKRLPEDIETDMTVTVEYKGTKVVVCGVEEKSKIALASGRTMTINLTSTFLSIMHKAAILWETGGNLWS